MLQAYRFFIKKGFTTFGLIGVVLSFKILVYMVVAVSNVPSYATLKEQSMAYMPLFAFDFSLYITYFLFFASILVTAVMAAMTMSHSKSSKASLITFGGTAVLLIICILIGSNGYSSLQLDKMKISGTTVKWIDGSLIATYIIFFGSIIALVGSEVYSSIKK
jgi:hypothetical protein